MSTAYSEASVIIPNSAGVKAGTLQAWRPDVNLLQDIDVVQNTANGSRVNEQGLIEFVPANTPRWDWSEGGSCPSLLVEPQRTNLFLQSEDFTTTWVNDANKLIITPAATTGVLATGFTKIVLKTGESTGNAKLVQTITKTAAVQTRVASIFAKEGEFDKVSLEIRGNGLANRLKVSWRLDTDAYNLDLVAGGFSVSSQGVVTYPNGDKRFYIIYETDNHTSLMTLIYAEDSATSTGDGTSGIFINGFMDEEGSFVSSYIKTVASIVTRNADVISKSGIASLIGQSEGTLYMEAEYFKENAFITLSDNTTSNMVYLGLSSKNRGVVASDGNIVGGILGSTINFNTKVKNAYAYNNNDFTLYFNGTNDGTASGILSFSSPLSVLKFASGINKFYGKITALAWWKTRLTNAELQNLTTP